MKIELPLNEKEIRIHSNTYWDGENNINMDTGLVRYPYFGTYLQDNVKTFVVKINSPDNKQLPHVSLELSIHKLFNYLHAKTPHNHNSLNIDHLRCVIEYLMTDFNCSAKNMKCRKWEFGKNLNFSKKPTDFINENLITFDHGISQINRKHYPTGIMAEIKKQQYCLKLYDKSGQYRMKENILRIEFKVEKENYLKTISKELLIPLTLEDILKEQIWDILNNHLSKLVSKLRIIDNFEYSIINDKENLLISQFKNPNFLDQSDMSRLLRHKWRKKNNELLNKFNLNKLKIELVDKIAIKNVLPLL